MHKDGRNKTYGRNKISFPRLSSLLFPTLFRSTSMYPILFSFSHWKMKIFHQLNTKSCSDREDRKVTNDFGGYPTNLCSHTTKRMSHMVYIKQTWNKHAGMMFGSHVYKYISRSSCVAAKAIHHSIFVHISNIHLFI